MVADSSLSCFRKVAHFDEDIAVKESVRLTFRYGTAIYPYKCENCGNWHTGKRTIVKRSYQHR